MFLKSVMRVYYKRKKLFALRFLSSIEQFECKSKKKYKTTMPPADKCIKKTPRTPKRAASEEEKRIRAAGTCTLPIPRAGGRQASFLLPFLVD
jgi:hypothetical protein